MNSQRVSLFASCLLFFACAVMQTQGALQTRNRPEFAAAMAKIKEGTSTNEILEILGKPDDIRTESDPGGIHRVNTKEIWCYGAESHLSFPTLGCVYIDENGRAQEVYGSTGKPLKLDLFSQDELRDLLQLLDTVPRMEGWRYNPRPLIQIVNRLQPLGKEKALAAIDEYLRISDNDGRREGMALVLMVLFDLPDGVYSFQAGGFGAAEPGPPKDPNRIPRFPMTIVDDIPLMLVNGYMMAGVPTPMEPFVDFYRVHGRLRSAPLVPANDPLAVITHLTNSPVWIFGDTNLQETKYNISFGPAEDSQREESMLREQALRLIDSVYRLPVDAMEQRLPWEKGERDAAWQKVVSDVAALKIKWDARQDMYVFQDGTHLAPVEKHIYQRQIWKLDGLGYEHAELTLERRDENWLDVRVDYRDTKGAKLIPAMLYLFTVDDPGKPIVTSQLVKIKGNGGGTSELVTHRLKAGTEVIAKLVTVNHQTNSSPVFRP